MDALPDRDGGGRSGGRSHRQPPTDLQRRSRSRRPLDARRRRRSRARVGRCPVRAGRGRRRRTRWWATAGRQAGVRLLPGPGVASRPGVACSDGYAAFLRLVWATGPTAADGGLVPRRLASGSPPPSFDVPVPAGLRGGIDKFLSGRSSRVLEGLAAASQADRYLRPALARDRRSAQSFFDFGPAPLRRLRLRHALRPGPLSRQTIVDLLEAEVREAIGDFRSPAVPDPTGGVLGRRDTTTRRIAASVRRHTSSPPFGTAGQ